jgi:hypothetical protein
MNNKKILVGLVFLPVRPWFEIVISYLAFCKFDDMLLINKYTVEYYLAIGVYDR